MNIRKAIIPAAGIGTRMLPATHAIPKELIPILDKPTIQYVVEEAVAAGITDILIIISKGKEAIKKHFERDYGKENVLDRQGKYDLSGMLRKLGQLANIQFVYQEEMNGLGDAVRHGKNFVGQEAFAVLLGDNIIESYSSTPILKQMVELYAKLQSSIVAVSEVPPELVNRYGVMAGESSSQDYVFKVNDWIEKPSISEAPSNLVVSGLYILSPAIFDCLENTPRGFGNEIQLTDAMRLLLKTEEMYAFQFDGKRHDIGNKLDFVKTNLVYGLKDAENGQILKEWLKSLILKE